MNSHFKIILILILTLFFQLLYSQGVYLIDYSSFCESDDVIEDKYLQERINSIEHQNYYWLIKATIIDDCGVKLYPKFRFQNDTLEIETYKIDFQINVLETKDTIFDMSQPEECYCGYLLSLKFSIDTIDNIKINGRILPITEERFLTFPIKYSVFNGDTTGYTDKYGLRQGVHIIKRYDKKILKQYYLDNKAIKYELFDSNGKLLLESEDFGDILDYK